MTEQETTLPALNSHSDTTLSQLLGVTLAVAMVAAIGAYAFFSPSPPRRGGCYEQEAGEQGYEPLDKWKKPLVALVVSGQMHGFIDPCGCSEPQYGGLPRRFNFIQSLKDKKWDVVGIDMGELPAIKGIHEQNLLKYELSVRSLGAMNYRALGIGRDEVLLPLGEGLAQIWDKNKSHPRPLNLTLDETAPKQKYHDLNVRQFEIIGDTKPKVGVISLMGPDLTDELTKLNEKFLVNKVELGKALTEMAKEDVEVGVVLLHEYPEVDKALQGFQRQKAINKARQDMAIKVADFCDEARKKNRKVPAIQLMMVLSDDPEPSALMHPVKEGLDTKMIEIGHKGKYVGVVGVKANPKGGYSLQYEMVLMEPKWEMKGTEKNNAVVALMEKYYQTLKSTRMLDKSPRNPHFNQIPENNGRGLKATFVGSERCGDCHQHAYALWEKERKSTDPAHAKATKTLEDKKHPSGRQFDPDCMMCHTTGFKHPGGYNNLIEGQLANWVAPKPGDPAPNPKKFLKHNDVLRDVGCESCHGPGSAHASNPDNKVWRALMNPYGPSDEERKLEAVKNPNAQQKQMLAGLSTNRMRTMGANLCMKCHDMENDVQWGQPGKDTADKWLKVIHRTPKNNNGGAIDPPAKNVEPPLIRNEPPLTIELIPEKKK